MVQFREGSKMWLQTLEIKLCKRLSQLHWAYFQFSWTDIASYSQLMVFVKYVHLNSFIRRSSFFVPVSKKLRKPSMSSKKVSSFFESENLLWENLCGCCTDGAPAMLGTKSGFQIYIKKQNPNTKSVHCMIHRHSLASKTLPLPLREVLDQTFRMVNFVKGGALNSRLFKQLCIDMDADHHVLLFHSNTNGFQEECN